MTMRLRLPPRSAVKASVALWSFAFSLVVAITAFRGRGTLELQFMIQFVFWVLAIGLSLVLYACFHRLRRAPPLARWPLLGLVCIAIGVLLSLADVALFAWLAHAYFPEWRSWAGFDLPHLASAWILYTWTFGLNLALFAMIGATEEARRQALRAAKAEAAVKGAQLALLRLQLNPHFLFNTLNTISGLMLEGDIRKADQMVTRLSEFLRASLDIDPNASAMLGDEFNTVDAYLQIEAVRFENRLEVRYDCPDVLRAAEVPSFILQPLIENAIKHAVTPAMRPVRVTVGARQHGDDLVLTVTDDGGRQDSPAKGAGGVGLQNIRARLAAAYGERGDLTTQHLPVGFRADLRLPLRLLPETHAAAPLVA